MKKYGMKPAMPSAKPRGPNRRTYTAATVTPTNTTSASTRCGASSVPAVTATAAGPSMSSGGHAPRAEVGLVDREVADHREHRGEDQQRDGLAR